jgi:hypothetical protein
MRDDTLREILNRLGELDRRAVRYRQGTVTTVSPLAVALGGSSTSYTSVKALAGFRPVVGDVVAALIFGNDMLVLDRVAAMDSMHLISGVGEPAFQNSWQNFDATTYAAGGRSARFWKDRGHVYLAGIVKSGTIGSTIFQLPAGYRPPQTGSAFWPLVANSAYATGAVDNSGNVAVTTGSNVFADLSPIHFQVDL